jgi:hypothetical protein
MTHMSEPLLSNRGAGIRDDAEEARYLIQVRVNGPLRRKVENWRKAQDCVPPLSQALRILVEKALAEVTAA